MKFFMDFFIQSKQSGFIIYWIALVVILGLIMAILILLKRKRFSRIVIEATSGDLKMIFSKYGKDYILKKERLVTRILQNVETKLAREFIYKMSIADIWIKKVSGKPASRYFNLILDYNIEEGFFSCFIHSLNNRKLAEIIGERIKDQDSLLKKIAMMSDGTSFDSRKAFFMLKDSLELLREMVFSCYWKQRLFALNILANDEDPSTRKLLSECFNDPESIIRKRMVQLIAPDKKEGKAEGIAPDKVLFEIMLKDPSPEVRKEAVKRFNDLFLEYPEVTLDSLTIEETIHLIEALRPANRKDESLATELMLHDNPEIRFAASLFMERSGVFNRFIKELDLGDRVDFNRKLNIIKNAVNCGTTEFLKTCFEVKTPESMLLLGEVLKSGGSKELVSRYFREAIGFSDLEIYRMGVEVAAKHGGEREREVMVEELKSRIDKKKYLDILLVNIKDLEDEDFIEPLIDILKVHEDFAEIVKEALLNKYSDGLVAAIIKNIRDVKTSERMKLHLLFVLAKLKKEYCMSFLFEHLPVIPVYWMSKFSEILRSYDSKILKNKIGYYLSQVDGRIKASIITLIPRTEMKDFYPQIRAGLSDIDPLVRIASAFALVDMNDAKSIKNAIDLLRDPVDEVREKIAFALARIGKKDVFGKLKNIFLDEDEVESVKKSILTGLSECLNSGSTKLLLDFLELESGLEKEIKDALAKHVSEKNIRIMVDRMKDESKETQKRIAEVFKKMGKRVKPELLNLLESRFTKLKDMVSLLLDEIGGTEDEIRKLNHKDPSIRREAAKNLSMINTLKAFRGLIMASRDPDQAVRINVVKALEKLETEEGKEILHDLENDPDLKIRKYTHWALERIKARELI